MYYVYAYIDPSTMLPFYIGKGCRNRAVFHLRLISSNRHKNKYFSNTIAKIKRETGLSPIIEIIAENLSEVDAYELEEKLVEQYGRKLYDENGLLCNLTKGGRGLIGYKHTDESKAKMSYMKQNLSDDAKRRMGDSRRGKKQSDEHIENRASKLRGRKITDTSPWMGQKSESHRLAIKTAQSGELCPRAKDWIITSPDGETFHVRSLTTFCEERGLKAVALLRSAKSEKPVTRGGSKGWLAKEIS